MVVTVVLLLLMTSIARTPDAFTFRTNSSMVCGINSCSDPCLRVAKDPHIKAERWQAREMLKDSQALPMASDTAGPEILG